MSHFFQFRHKVQHHIAKYNLFPAIPNCPQTNHFIVHYSSYQLAWLVGNTDSHVTNSSEFVSFIQTQKLAQKDILMSFDVVSLFTRVPVELAVKTSVDQIFLTGETKNLLQCPDYTWSPEDRVSKLRKCSNFNSNTLIVLDMICGTSNSPIFPQLSNVRM